MAQVVLLVGGRRYELACRDGEEARLRDLAAMVDAKAGEAARAVGSGNEARQLLLAALLLADDVTELRGGAIAGDAAVAADAIETLALRLEELASRIER